MATGMVITTGLPSLSVRVIREPPNVLPRSEARTRVLTLAGYFSDQRYAKILSANASGCSRCMKWPPGTSSTMYSFWNIAAARR